jgi:hypothetical protein
MSLFSRKLKDQSEKLLKRKAESPKQQARQIPNWQKSFMLSALSFTLKRNSGAYIGGVHLFPFRTEKLSPPEPMVLQ